jgi:hypothetical protein
LFYDKIRKREDGRLEMTITIPDETTLNNMARSLAQMAGAGQRYDEDIVSANQ